MFVIPAESLGMCFGVRNAIRTAMEIAHPERTVIFGELVHNDEVLKELGKRGFEQAPEGCRGPIPEKPTVLVTAHGISEREKRRLEAAGKEIIDATCPLVRMIHQTALRLKESGCFVVVIGKRGHVEVEGLIGDLDRFAVVECIEEAGAYNGDPIGVICQSTVSLDAAREIVERIRAMNPGRSVRFIPTICHSTRQRLAAALALFELVEAMVVVGGRRSNNTLALAALAQKHGVPCLHVENAAELDVQWLSKFQVAGLTAGTSTPGWTINEVHERLLSIRPAVSPGRLFDPERLAG